MHFMNYGEYSKIYYNAILNIKTNEATVYYNL